ncbi:hypothetical protein BDV33DRAFT_178739 [Aspergillus novoparasiticus]|uniref:Uncharacterized protein n=1 Tax=Aspergillus novoparasiticus TaxID=986946 RepID=A0A5N6EI93_9EURO|nr:hypothetical protein BDV33DRAFT_178739 [Aspergillus novoparasiticus]
MTKRCGAIEFSPPTLKPGNNTPSLIGGTASTPLLFLPRPRKQTSTRSGLDHDSIYC